MGSIFVYYCSSIASDKLADEQVEREVVDPCAQERFVVALSQQSQDRGQRRESGLGLAFQSSQIRWQPRSLGHVDQVVDTAGQDDRPCCGIRVLPVWGQRQQHPSDQGFFVCVCVCFFFYSACNACSTYMNWCRSRTARTTTTWDRN